MTLQEMSAEYEAAAERLRLRLMMVVSFQTASRLRLRKI